jgi:hypothetical protein
VLPMRLRMLSVNMVVRQRLRTLGEPGCGSQTPL